MPRVQATDRWSVRGQMSRVWQSLWFRVALISSVALAVTLALVVFAVYQLTLVTERRTLDAILTEEGSALADMIQGEVETRPGALTLGELEVIANRGLAVNPGSSVHLSLVRLGDTVLTSARGPDRLEQLRAAGLLPSSPPGMLTSVTGVRARSEELRLGNLVMTVETMGDDAAIAAEAREVASRTALAALIAGLFGLVGITAVVHRSTRGIGLVASTVRATRLEHLTARVPETPGSNEVDLLGRDVNAMLDELASARAAKDELIALVSHELRTPLAAARGHTELLAIGRAPNPPETVRRIERELGRLNRLVDDLLALSRAGDPRWLARRLVRVDSILSALAERLPVIGSERISIGTAPDVLVEVDQDRILQALSNLVANAINHTSEHTRVVVTARVEQAGVVFTVTDDGPGIPPEILERAGTAFVRGSDTGTGLGLAVCRAVAMAHGGTMEVISDASGTTVNLNIPIE